MVGVGADGDHVLPIAAVVVGDAVAGDVDFGLRRFGPSRHRYLGGVPPRAVADVVLRGELELVGGFRDQVLQDVGSTCHRNNDHV